MIAPDVKVCATMDPDMPVLQPSVARVTVAYLLAVTAATGSIVVSQFPHVISQRASGGLLYPLEGTLGVLLSDCLVIFVLLVPGALLSALLCIVLYLFVSHFGIRNPLFYVSVGCVLALLGAATVVSAMSGSTWYTDPPNPPPPPNFWQEVLLISPVLAFAGAIAGLTFWLAAGRHILKRAA
ncbi:hypothetical protein [Trinickia dinghuensis]|uniref:Uncharacterized protein n=1 Tax=Trinickia dinghuensis TaxID=2291023 RepID=A0A3D8K7L9_9BURK|nr:hypothetical protein [Trinickia dinghuensis]RDV00886.1 hypothetical protein DWV00_03900 [Trinickia dinghuensis]